MAVSPAAMRAALIGTIGRLHPASREQGAVQGHQGGGFADDLPLHVRALGDP